MDSYSYERQDEFVLKLQKYLKPEYQNHDHYYLDVACGHPQTGSNTYILDSAYGWSGIGYDIVAHNETLWKDLGRRGKCIIQDVCLPEFTTSLIQENRTHYDYLSLDVDIGGSYENNLGHLALERILQANISCKIITYEHESFKYGNNAKNWVRDRLMALGYVILFPDVCFPDGRPWEDWIIHPTYFTNKLLALSQPKLIYHTIIDERLA